MDGSGVQDLRLNPTPQALNRNNLGFMSSFAHAFVQNLGFTGGSESRTCSWWITGKQNKLGGLGFGQR